MKLQSMTDFVLTPMLELVSKNTLDKLEPYQYHKYKHSLDIKFAKFLKQPLTLGMFIPCDENGNVLEEYKKTISEQFSDDNCLCRALSKEESSFIKAKERVLFKGFEILYQDQEDDCIHGKNKQAFIFNRKKKLCESDNGDELKTIEDLVKYNLELTESAIKQLGL